MGKRTVVGKFIHSSWTSLNIRCGKYKAYNTKNKCKSYENISIEFTREEYKQFCLERIGIIESLKRPSLDRKDKTKNYSLNNIQIIELIENIIKDKTIFNYVNNTGTCSICKEVKNIEQFSKDKRRYIGRGSICKSCDSKRKKNIKNNSTGNN